MPIHPQEGAPPLTASTRRPRPAGPARAGLLLALSLALFPCVAAAQDPAPPVPQAPPLPQPTIPVHPPPSLLPPDTTPRLSISEAPQSDSAELVRGWGIPGLRVFGRDLFTRATSQFQ